MAFSSQPSPFVSIGMKGFPKKLKFIHKYADFATFSAGAGATSIRQFSCNGLYDPDITSTGHQPSYFDNLTAIYDHYTVFRSTFRVRILPSTNVLQVGLYVEDDVTAVSFAQQAAEQGTGTLGVLAQTAVRPLVLTKTWNAKEYFGGDIFDNDNLQGTSSANPTEQSYFTLAVNSFDSLTFSYNISYEIVYEAVWDELKTMPIN